MNNAARLGAGVAGGYLLGRTKKLKLAIGLGAWLMGKRLNLSPSQLAIQGLGQLRDTPEFLDLTERLRGEVGGAGRRALAAVAMSRMDSLADRLHDRNLGIVEGTVLSDDDDEYDERDEEDGGDGGDDAAYDEEDDYDDQQDYDDEGDEGDEEDEEDEEDADDEDAPRDSDEEEDYDEDEEDDEDYDDEPKSRRDEMDEPYPDEEQQPRRSRSGSRSRTRGGQR